jgi:hypothetical protein
MGKDYRYNYKNLVQHHKNIKSYCDNDKLKALPKFEEVRQKVCDFPLLEELDVLKGTKGVRQGLENIKVILNDTHKILNEQIKGQELIIPLELMVFEKLVSNYKEDVSLTLNNLKSCHIEAKSYLAQIEKQVHELFDKDEKDPKGNELLAQILEADQLRKDVYKGSVNMGLSQSIQKCLNDKDPVHKFKIIQFLEEFYEHGIFTKYYTEDKHESYFIQGLSYAYEQTKSDPDTHQLLGEMYPEYIQDFNL